MIAQCDAPAAVLSDCGTYRYFLSRRFGFEARTVAFIGLNPSIADATLDDPTIRRCVNFAKSWGAGSLWMVNLFAFRSTQPRALHAAADPIGPDNDAWLDRAVSAAELVVAAWGTHGSLLGRSEQVRRRFQGKLHSLSLTKSGMPGHPLYIRADTKPSPF